LRVGGVAKGFPAFQGFGVIERAELIAQYDARQVCSQGHSDALGRDEETDAQVEQRN
jgi:hypothetical protein